MADSDFEECDCPVEEKSALFGKHKELWLVQVPKNFDLEALDDVKVVLPAEKEDGNETMPVELAEMNDKDNVTTTLLSKSFTTCASQFHCILPHESSFVSGPNFSRFLKVVNKDDGGEYVDTLIGSPVVKKKPQKIKKLQNLKIRFQMHGEEAVEQHITKKPKGKKGSKRKRAESLEPTSSDSSRKAKKSKKKKRKSA